METAVLTGLAKFVERTAHDFEPGVFDITNIEAAVNAWAAIERVACSAKLLAAGRLEEVGLDPEQAVADASGLSSGQARRQTRLRKKLKGKKKTQDAFDKGKLSPTQTRLRRAGWVARSLDAGTQMASKKTTMKAFPKAALPRCSTSAGCARTTTTSKHAACSGCGATRPVAFTGNPFRPMSGGPAR